MSADDWISLGVFAGIVGAFFLARRRHSNRVAAAVAAAHVEGIETGRQQVFAQFGASVVVHNHNGDRNGFGASDDDGTSFLDHERVAGLRDAAGFVGLRRVEDRRGHLGDGVPVGLRAGWDRDPHRAAGSSGVIGSAQRRELDAASERPAPPEREP